MKLMIWIFDTHHCNERNIGEWGFRVRVRTRRLARVGRLCSLNAAHRHVVHRTRNAVTNTDAGRGSGHNGHWSALERSPESRSEQAELQQWVQRERLRSPLGSAARVHWHRADVTAAYALSSSSSSSKHESEERDGRGHSHGCSDGPAREREGLECLRGGVRPRSRQWAHEGRCARVRGERNSSMRNRCSGWTSVWGEHEGAWASRWPRGPGRDWEVLLRLLVE